jgi:hypothetical protein
MIFLLSEGTAAERRFPIYLVDATDGLTPETGEAAGQPQISKNGAAFGNTSATLTAVGNGSYYVELTAAELDTLGMIQVRYKSANTAEFAAPARVVAFDPFDAVRLGVTSLPNAAAAAAGGLFTRGTGAGQINQTVNGTIDIQTVLGSVVGNVSGSVASVVGSVGGSLAGNVSGTVNDVVTKTGYRLSATGVDDILDEIIPEPAGVFAWASASLRTMLGWFGVVARNRVTATATTITARNDANSADLATSTQSDDATTYVRGEWS